MIKQLSRRLLSWASILDDTTREQAERMARLPFVHPHIALMPDAHSGKGASVGSVIPTVGAVIPAAVGVDIGCGMMAVRTQFRVDDLPSDRAELRESIEAAIPTSAGQYNQTITETADERLDSLWDSARERVIRPTMYDSRWEYQLGTLGSGNHFIEVTADEENRVWLFLHSGSRGIGNKIAQHHIKVARQLCQRWWIELEDPDLAYLVQGTSEFSRYMAELHWAQTFAKFNREEMMDRVITCVARWTGIEVERVETVNCHHNYTAWEHHGGKDVIVSRKGAINAHQGVLGLIPGSMGAASYVVEGKGNSASICSAPHGAGRLMSRTQARKAFTQDELREAMQGIEYRDSAELVDEIPGAYKPIDQVMADAADLVTIKHELHQLINVKGD